MAATSGTAGSVVLNGTAVAQVSEWSFNIAADVVEVTVMGSDWRTYVPGLAGATGSFTLFYDPTAPAMHPTLRTAILSRTAGSASLYAGTAANFYSAATIYITGLSPTVSVDGAATDSYDFTVSGAVTYT